MWYDSHKENSALINCGPLSDNSTSEMPCRGNWTQDFATRVAARLVSRRIAGPGELFSPDFRACARSSRGATRCSFGSVSCSCDAAPRSAVLNWALPAVSSLQSEQRRTWLIFAKQIEILQVKVWLATFKAKNANLRLLVDRWKKKTKKNKKNSSIHLRRVFTPPSVDRSWIASASVAAGLFPNLSCLVSLICSLLTGVFYNTQSLPFFSTKPCWTKLFSGLPAEA